MSNLDGPHEIINKLSELTKNLHEVLQDSFFDSLAFSKLTQLRQKLEGGNFQRIDRIFLGDHLKNARPLDSGREYRNLPIDFLASEPGVFPKHSLFLLTNNDIGTNLPRFLEFYSQANHLLFVIWDWDSQHWIQMSSILAMHSDFYISGTAENAFLLSHFNPWVLGPVFIGVHQWTRKFIIDHMDCLFGDRTDSPFGLHVHYGKYPRRNRLIATLGQSFESVGFANNDYKLRSELENLQQWSSFKTHWIVPVLGGVPIRVYNAMITGGIPILPAFYKNMPEVALLGNTPLYYDVPDLLEPEPIHRAAVAKFDSGGESGLIQRVTEVIARHHIDTRCESIFQMVEESVRKILSGDKGHEAGYVSMTA